MSLVLLIAIWVALLIVGFGLIHLALWRSTLPRSLYFSGITFFTVGYGDMVPHSLAMRAAAVIEAGCGLGFLALVIGYLPVLYQLFARREARVMLLDERAGSPPTALVLMKRHAEGAARFAGAAFAGMEIVGFGAAGEPHVVSDAHVL